jgi:hypothetical protein
MATPVRRPFRPILAAEWVAQRRAGGVDNLGWNEFDVAVVDEDVPTGVMHVPMMRFAQQDAV